MGIIIRKIRLINFKRFKDYTIEPNERINILVGDNEVGKSSILEAIDLVASGSMHQVGTIGLEKLLNIESVNNFFRGERTFDNLPVLRIELYLALDSPDPFMNGKNNTEKMVTDGIRLVCEPNADYRTEIKESLSAHKDYFPYDYYTFRYSTFADEGYSGYKKKLRIAMIDSSNMSSEYVTADFIRRMYMQYTEAYKKERAQHKCAYRFLRNNFDNENLKELNKRLPSDKNYKFGLRGGNSLELETNLMIYENGIGIDSKGTGQQVFVKTDFALERAGENVDIILIEEPENHLSPVNLRKLIQLVGKTQDGQLFITTHNSLISTRLELQNLMIMHINGDEKPVTLKDLHKDTAKYFMKTPPANIIEFALAQKVILVEGPSEYMLLERFFHNVTGCMPEDENIHIIDIRGLSFLRYLEIAKLTNSKVAVITDNDGDYHKNCIEKYNNYVDLQNIQVFYDENNEMRTFEIILYENNITLCDELFGREARMLMLNNKTESAYKLLSQEQVINVPDYIERAIKWIKN